MKFKYFSVNKKGVIYYFRLNILEEQGELIEPHSYHPPTLFPYDKTKNDILHYIDDMIESENEIEEKIVEL